MSEHAPVVDPRPGRVFDAFVTLGGLGVAVLGFALWVSSAPMTVHPQTVVAAVLVVVMTQFPLVLPQRAGDAAIGFEASALVFMVLVTSTGEALSLWFVAQLVTQLLDHRPPRVRLFNFGITNLAAGALAGVIVLGMSVPRDTVGELCMTLAACAAYFLVDLIVTGMSLAIEVGDQPLSGLRWTGVPLPLLCFVGIDTLGYLAAVLERHLASWTLVLLMVPVGTILVAVRSLNAGRTSHERLSRLFSAAATAPDWGDAAGTETRLVEEVSTVLRRTTACILDRPAIGGEISAPLEVRGQPVRHVVAWRSRATEKFDRDDKRTLETLVGIAAAAINRRRLADEMTHLARHDPLTGLANRTVFTDRLDHALELRRDAGPAKQVAILYCDLDGFKSVNDRRGHESGDLLLAIVAGRIQHCLRPGDTAARLGGDEFAVLLEQVMTGGAEQVAERMLEQIALPLKIDGSQVRVTASIGIAYVTDEQRAVDVMRHADTAMYRAKAGGKNAFELFHPIMQADSLSRLRLEDELRVAVQNRVFTVAYQPIIDLATGQLSSFEALARWEHPELGVIAPDRFIPIAERLGLIGEIGLHMLEEAYVGGHALQSSLGRPLGLAVNVSPLQITDPKLVRWVQSCVARHPQIGLTLELTEMSRLGEDDVTVRALDELVGAGAVLAADDFGTGYSSISYLHRLPVTTVKIDRSFTKDLTVGRSLPVVKGVVAMSRAMDLTVVAEGIEDGATAAELRDMGVRLGQGYYFSRPMTLEEALDWIGTFATTSAVTSVRSYAAARS